MSATTAMAAAIATKATTIGNIIVRNEAGSLQETAVFGTDMQLNAIHSIWDALQMAKTINPHEFSREMHEHIFKVRQKNGNLVMHTKKQTSEIKIVAALRGYVVQEGDFITYHKLNL
mmetsp:Transcript_30750/g.35876  ORF Transcript_30750/g.35876 Transcript_30750/m.35876 type:complete len:117 (-) Transcript_30750:233-583(-)